MEEDLIPSNANEESMTSLPVPEGMTDAFFIHLKNKSTLYSAYMPFTKGGGLFLATDKKYELGNMIYVVVKLMDETEKFSFPSKVVWLCPQGGQGNFPAGIGVQFIDDQGQMVRKKIETYLAGALQSERRTDTL